MPTLVKERLPNEFSDADGDWIWTNLAKLPPYHVPLTSITGWRKNGCAALGGKSPTIKTVKGKGWGAGRRNYIRASELKQIRDFRTGNADIPNDWISYDEAVAMGADRRMLIKHAGSDDPRRRADPVLHPALGRPIRAKSFVVAREDGHSQKVLRLWRADIVKIVEIPSPAKWATRKQARDEYGLEDGDLQYASNAGRLTTKPFAAPPRHGQRTETLHFFRPHLEKLAADKNEKLKPGVDRCFQDLTGIYWPQAEALKRSQSTSADFMRWKITCPYLGDKPLKPRRVKMTLYRSKHGPMAMVYAEADLDRIREGRKGNAEGMAKTAEQAPQEKLPQRNAVINAVVLLNEQPGLTIREIARRVGCAHTTLTRSPLFQKALALATGANEPRHGLKTIDGQIEATADGIEDDE